MLIIFLLVATTITAACTVFYILKKPREISFKKRASKNFNQPNVISSNYNSQNGNKEESLGYFRTVQLTSDFDLKNYHEVKDNEEILSTLSQLLPTSVTTFASFTSNIANNLNKNAYQVFLKNGHELMNSTTGNGLKKGMTHIAGKRGIAGSADLRKIDEKASVVANKAGLAAGLMSISSMVVGQYYMSEINNRLDKINQSVESVLTFQSTELYSGVRSVIRETKNIAKYNKEIVHSETERLDARGHVRILEEKSGKLLDQINALILSQMGNMKDFDEYQKHTATIFSLVSAQKALLATLKELSLLVIVLSNSEVSPERAGETYLELSTNVKKTHDVIKDWHNKENGLFQVDVIQARRRKTGLEGILIQPVALLNPEFAYEKISKQFLSQLVFENPSQMTDLPQATGYQNPVELLVHDKHVYYRVPNE